MHCEAAAGSDSGLPLIEGYGGELENDYECRQIFSNHRLPKALAATPLPVECRPESGVEA